VDLAEPRNEKSKKTLNPWNSWTRGPGFQTLFAQNASEAYFGWILFKQYYVSKSVKFAMH